MMIQFDFQDESVDWLLEVSTKPNTKQTIVLKAPTGSGKTIILINYINKYLNINNKKTAFIWLCPGKGDLEEQSRNKMMTFFPSRKTFDLFDVLANGFSENSTTFINWERVTKKDNKAITDSEKKNLFERIKQAHKSGVSFILIIDEEHSNNTSKARDIIDYFCADHIIRVSATTISNKNVEFKEIDEQDVIDAGLITSAISVNEGIETGMPEDDNLLLELADKKRKEIYKQYHDIGKDIRPLVLIQFPNGEPEKIKAIEGKLNEMGYSRENGTVAAWLSGDKADIPENLTANNSELAFLFIKQAINTGWDCPRAKILVKLREGSNEAFQVQTIGRIRRMPEHKHYNIDVLDLCYVYTFDKEFKTGLLAGLDKAYIPKRLFLKEKCRDFKLTKELRDMDGDTADMRTVYKQIRDYYVKKYSLDNNKSMNQKKLARVYCFDKNLIGSVVNGVFTLTDSVIDGTSTIATSTPVNTHLHGIEMRHTIDTFKNIIGIQAETVRQIFDRLFCFKYSNKDKLLSLSIKEYYAFIINNQHLIRDALRNISSEVNLQNRMIHPKTATFTIPIEELYHFDPMEKNHKVLNSNAYKDYTMEYVTINCGKSNSEILFEKYCESNSNVDWVYKNGDKGQQYFSIVYYNSFSKTQKLFYPDYIVKLNDGRVWIIEAKGGQAGKTDKNIDKQVMNKFLTFKRYAEDYNICWGFVRDMNNDLYFNNTTYVSNLHDDNWVLLEEVF